MKKMDKGKRFKTFKTRISRITWINSSTINLALWAKPIPLCGSQRQKAYPQKKLECWSNGILEFWASGVAF